MSFVGQHKGAIVWSVLLHGTVATALLLTFKLPARTLPPVPAAPIQGVIVDQAVLERQERDRQQAEQRERDRVRRQERERREAVERQQAEQREERERRDDAERQRVAAEKREQERVAAEKREQEQRQQAQREREAREKAAAEQRRRQQQAERELQEALAMERATADAVAAGLLDQYMLMIQSRVKQFWVKPLTARPGIDCVVAVTQLPTGDVTDARIVRCNGDDAVRRSIEKAVRDASPLPRAPSQAVFSRTFTIRFQPDK